MSREHPSDRAADELAIQVTLDVAPIQTYQPALHGIVIQESGD